MVKLSIYFELSNFEYNNFIYKQLLIFPIYLKLSEYNRLSLEGRKSRIVVVLIQKQMSVPAVDDTITTERAASLCEACTLNPKALFILPVVDNIHGYAIR